jgi:hypothetical protein
MYICIRIQGIPDETLGELAEWSNAAVLKTVEGHTSGGSNPSFSAKGNPQRKLWVLCFPKIHKLFFRMFRKTKKTKFLQRICVSMFAKDFRFGVHDQWREFCVFCKRRSNLQDMFFCCRKYYL